MKSVTAKLTGKALNYAVAKALGGRGLFYDSIATHWIKIDGKDRALSKGWAQSFTPSENWSHGGPIIENAQLCVGFKHQPDPAHYQLNESETVCWARTTSGGYLSHGPTPLIAAMRCYVASILGAEVNIPETLL